ncbi:translation initiation factor IF-2 [Desulforamulus hydrothermalis]|uniref:Translation initiation factor IF-2 n=1 Tax=Desulforamulus hydrothermalis Lam5 = DSM 18033 TaxID=1121428 RepID=K8E153_9FIRM|nr:translation initiation factor IF-2 [Desulforamulus hydrothermalis]CCO09424.1 translation initiation factor IF-2 [Desulforamulus hydrothermalis Lam5 = DSM 18033]SHH08459.1 bacterial translation initiation factor 2 (bIF-2) [Desulforamulus hydrothermalis Lam5 = DSM 18033]
MAKKRVHELAKELNIENKDLINKLIELGIQVKSHMSALEDSDVQKILHSYRPPKGLPEEKKTEPVTKQNMQERGRGQGMEGKKEKDQFFRPDNSKGPGLVDRVPNRPPDRRYEDKPKSPQRPPRDNRPVRTSAAKDGGRQEVKDTAHQAAGHNRPQRPPGGGRPQGERTTQAHHQGRPEQRERFNQNQVKSAAGQQSAGAQGRPQQAERAGGARPPQGDRPAGPGKDRGNVRPAHGGRGGGPRPSNPSIPKPPEQIAQPKPTKAPDKTKGDRRKNYEKDGKWADQSIENTKLNKHRLQKSKKKQEQPAPPVIPDKRPVQIGETVTVQELAEKLKKTAAEVIKKLMNLGVLATINQEIDFDTAALIAGEYGVEAELKVAVDKEALIMTEPEDDPAQLVPRPPVVTIMGHVDHGKTSLLDAIRQTNVTAGEAGGITQHIGAYQVEHNGKKITFVDTPGHAAFTAMRARGAQITDIAILVVAADDGVMPQTVEAINHAKAANVPIIVAINKMDKPEANPDKVKQELTQHELVVEDWGGDVIAVPVSAKTGMGLDNLLEMILLVAEVHELKANPNRPARGTVVEAELDKGRGPVATVLVQNGTLHVGDTIVVGHAFGRVRAMIDDKGRRVKKAGPSMPVEILGLSDVPEAGDILVVVEDEKLAREVAEKRQLRKREEILKATAKISLDDLFKHIQEGQIKELPIILKADVQGSIEALAQALEKLSTDEVKVNLIHSGVGAINESDIMLATASNAIVIGFNVRPDANARKIAEAEKIDIHLYRVIYEVIDDVKKAMSGLLDPEYKEVIMGHVEVRKIFKASKIGTIAGCYVTEGKIVRDAGIRLIRDGIVIHEGKLDSLKRFKDDVKEVAQGYECGITIENFNDIQEGDIIEAYTVETIKRELA